MKGSRHSNWPRPGLSTFRKSASKQSYSCTSYYVILLRSSSSFFEGKKDDLHEVQNAGKGHARPDQRKVQPNVHVSRHGLLIPPVERQQEERQMEQPLGESPAGVPWVENG